MFDFFNQKLYLHSICYLEKKNLCFMPFIYDFADGHQLDDALSLLGNKGANLSEMTRLGLPVPPGFTLTTEACKDYQKSGVLSEALKAKVISHLEKLGGKLGRFYGDSEKPLLVSVRSGASISMPGMMETLLNVGLTSSTLEGFKSFLQNEEAALDCYRRFLQMYGGIVCDIPSILFQKYLGEKLQAYHLEKESQLSKKALSELNHTYASLIESETGTPLLSDPYHYLWQSIESVFKSWQSPRAQTYRRLHQLPDDLGTAVTVQAMVFGNLDDQSASGVAFTRHPSTGQKVIFGEYLRCAQGEDVVAGTHTPHSLTQGARSLSVQMPSLFADLERTAARLEKHYKAMQDLEFTIEKGKLWMLQTRKGKCSAEASVRMAVEMVKEGLLTEKEALLRVNPLELERLLLPCLDSTVTETAFAQGFAGAPGAASGKIVFTAEDAVKEQEKGIKVILVRPETNADDVHGIWSAEGVLTQKGGTTSHAAVVARGMGKPCVVGAGALEILPNDLLKVGSVTLKKGDVITLDGHTGKAYVGDLPRKEPRLTKDLNTLMGWADRHRRLGVRANAETRADILKALELGAEGIGLCRTEHMFFEPSNLLAFQKMILSQSDEERKKAIDGLMPLQKKGFKEIFQALRGIPVTVRLLDPPLHEFMPSSSEDLQRLAQATGLPYDEIQRRQESLKELNPMLGHRGCRLAISFPDLYAMQARALFESALEVKKEGTPVELELMVPLISTASEVRFLKKIILQTHTDVEEAYKESLPFTYGCMIETPRAALTAEHIAKDVDFFSFGTNDLTQLTYGLSRDDFAPFWPAYEETGTFSENPFTTLDVTGVGSLIKRTVSAGQEAKHTLKIGICGEHGGDPVSINFFHECGLHYVSCSPYRVLCAKLAAAQAHLTKKLKN